jgi:hypothetical protein
MLGGKGRGLELNTNSTKVSCYSGHTYAERPLSFEWQGTEYEIGEVEEAWQEPRERHFQVRTRDNKMFKLCYNETQNRWVLIELVGR